MRPLTGYCDRLNCEGNELWHRRLRTLEIRSSTPARVCSNCCASESWTAERSEPPIIAGANVKQVHPLASQAGYGLLQTRMDRVSWREVHI
jgi:hypothetical protein